MTALDHAPLAQAPPPPRDAPGAGPAAPPPTRLPLLARSFLMLAPDAEGVEGVSAGAENRGIVGLRLALKLGGAWHSYTVSWREAWECEGDAARRRAVAEQAVNGLRAEALGAAWRR